jgi:hypothetical protein
MVVDRGLYVLVNLTHLQVTGELIKAKDLISVGVRVRFRPLINLANTRAIVQIKPSYRIDRFREFIDHPAVLGYGDVEMARDYVRSTEDQWPSEEE